jgi:hypothetical protein
MKEIPRKYIGDGIYAKFDGCLFVLTTRNSIQTTNTITLGPQSLQAFDEYREALKQQFQTEANRKLKHLQRKVAHGCADACCKECDA